MINLDTNTNSKKIVVAFNNYRGNACLIYPESITSEELSWLALDGAGEGLTHTGETLRGHSCCFKLELTGRSFQRVPGHGTQGVRAKITFLDHDFDDGFSWGEPVSCFVYEAR